MELVTLCEYLRLAVVLSYCLFWSSAPKRGLSKGGVTVSPDEPWAREGKEFVRAAVIGQTVTVDVEYGRTFSR